MKTFSQYSAEELAMERLFIRWVQSPEDQPIRTFWEGWLRKFPEKTETVETARELVEVASIWSGDRLTHQEAQSLALRIQNSISSPSVVQDHVWLSDLWSRENLWKTIVITVLLVVLIIQLISALN